MANGLSKTQLDKLGDRLRAGSKEDADLRALDEYRRSFRETYDVVVSTLRTRLELEPTGRPAKTTGAIVGKLNRQRIRLTQIQDIAGVRIVTTDVLEQDALVQRISNTFGTIAIDDRRLKPSHGYRAVHAIVVVNQQQVEIQIRTRLQHQWAEVSEKLADLIDPSIKYGGGSTLVRETLDSYSALVQDWEGVERRHAEMLQAAELFKKVTALPEQTEETKKVLQNQASEFESKVAHERSTIGRKIHGLADVILRSLGHTKD